MFCPNCGKELKNDAVFCSHCGKKVTGEIPAAGKSGNGKKIAVIAGVIALGLAVAVTGCLVLKNRSSREDKPDAQSGDTTAAEDTTAEDSTAEDTAAEDTTAEDSTAEDSAAEDSTAESGDDEADVSDDGIDYDKVFETFSDYYYDQGFGSGNDKFAFVYIDDDSIPECIVQDENQEPSVLSYHDGQITETQRKSELGMYPSLHYAKGEGAFLFASIGGSMTATDFYHLDDGVVSYDGSVSMMEAPLGNDVVQEFYIDNEKVSEAEYYKFKDKFGSGYENIPAYDDMEFYMSDAWEKAVD